MGHFVQGDLLDIEVPVIDEVALIPDQEWQEEKKARQQSQSEDLSVLTKRIFTVGVQFVHSYVLFVLLLTGGSFHS